MESNFTLISCSLKSFGQHVGKEDGCDWDKVKIEACVEDRDDSVDHAEHNISKRAFLPVYADVLRDPTKLALKLHVVVSVFLFHASV